MKFVTTILSQMTFQLLEKNVPKKSAWNCFLSGGQSSDLAADRLNLLNQLYTNKAWNLTFSYGRALQKDALLKFSKGDMQGVKTARY